VEAADASIRQAELNVEYCTVTTPIEGIAGTRQVAPGNLVGNGDATLLTTVSDINPMRVYVSISESDYLMYSRMKAQGKMKGGAGELELILADGSVFPEKGRIIIADRAVDLKTGTLSPVAEFPNPNALLRPGQLRPCSAGGHCGGERLAGPQRRLWRCKAQRSSTSWATTTR
jgi:membrane fusion protein (multidrug efflux system)